MSLFPDFWRMKGEHDEQLDSSAFTPLNPRQALTASPYAITARDVTSPNISRLNVPNTATQAAGVPTVSCGFIVNAAVTAAARVMGRLRP